MNLTDLFPDAPEISFEAIREGDIIARMASGNVLVSEAVNQTSFHGPGKWLSENQDTFAAIKGRMHLLFRRAAPKLPAELGCMVRVLASRRSAFTHPGDVFVLSDGKFRCSETANELDPEEFERYGITWEQVWFTNMGPDMDLVDAEVLPAEDEPEPAVALPGGPVLIHITSGRYKGAVARRSVESRRYDFVGLSADGCSLGLTSEDVEAGWEAVTLVRNNAYYRDPLF